MASKKAGWYPDPKGDGSKLRFWDGYIWTSDYVDASEAVEPIPHPGSQVDDEVQVELVEEVKTSVEAPQSTEEEAPLDAHARAEAQQAKQGFNGYALAAMVCGVISMFLILISLFFSSVYIYVSFVLGAVAIVTGIKGRNYTMNFKLATFGVVVGVLVMVVIVVLVIFSFIASSQVLAP